jgi:hypothetical protein
MFSFLKSVGKRFIPLHGTIHVLLLKTYSTELLNSYTDLISRKKNHFNVCNTLHPCSRMETAHHRFLMLDKILSLNIELQGFVGYIPTRSQPKGWISFKPNTGTRGKEEMGTNAWFGHRVSASQKTSITPMNPPCSIFQLQILTILLLEPIDIRTPYSFASKLNSLLPK